MYTISIGLNTALHANFENKENNI